ncbi:MAG: hypothetical protein JO055_12295 [Alphaproteobacteria bacterium]|nr:hypothetical protein [Alphaproteobacteria bacterium]
MDLKPQAIRERTARVDELWAGLSVLADVDGPRSMPYSDFQLRLGQRGFGTGCAGRTQARLVELGLAEQLGLVLMLTDAGDRAFLRGRQGLDAILTPA